MWFIGVEVEQETSAPPPKKILDSPLHTEVMFVYPLRGALAKKIRAHDKRDGTIRAKNSTFGYFNGTNQVSSCGLLPRLWLL